MVVAKSNTYRFIPHLPKRKRRPGQPWPQLIANHTAIRFHQSNSHPRSEMVERGLDGLGQLWYTNVQLWREQYAINKSSPAFCMESRASIRFKVTFFD